MIASTPTPILVLALPFASIALLLTFTRIYTNFSYKRALAAHLGRSSNSKNVALPPPQIPYTIPFLGSALDFLAPKPGLFWSSLFKIHPRETGACTLLLGGEMVHILFSPTAVQALFKRRELGSDETKGKILERSMGMPVEDVRIFYGLDGKNKRRDWKGEGRAEEDPNELSERVNLDTLVKTEAVNELTFEFTKAFCEQLDSAFEKLEGDIGLVAWIKSAMFKASAIAFMGTRVFEDIPDYEQQFWDFDRVMLGLYFGLPRFVTPSAFRIRDSIVSSFERFHEKLQAEGKDRPIDPEGEVVWEPTYGSRANRARQRLYQTLKLSNRARAGLDLGFTFGLSSNAIPATCWMLLHILNPLGPSNLLPRVLAELKTAKLPSGHLNISILCGLPLLTSIFHEILRMYGDILLTREIHQLLTLPLDENKEFPRSVALSAGSRVMAPTWLGHYDPASWDAPDHPASEFYAERFLTTHPETGKDVFTMSGRAGKFFPFGGGKSICPGRVFAKQEVLGAVGIVLTRFEFGVGGFFDEEGKERGTFPGLRDAYGGTGVMSMEGDLRVRIERRI
ncbi:cytochrome P450 [Venturia nashicola]|uniref:Cytochrome P450 n=1 Tax=Venturia nashicola TaxID=86259 RepID=A0A4Z1NUK0_9PEZI|nr:cytochrome P450 [Venturia nashicola]TLD28125.1 cytochrome P450 [Venturia nashicola]